jgi:hypothetical protein
MSEASSPPSYRTQATLPPSYTAVQLDSFNATIIKSLADPSKGPTWFKQILTRLPNSRVLGSGGFATVYEVNVTDLIADGSSPKFVAVKKLRVNAVNDTIRRQFNSEVASMQHMTDPQIVRVLGSRCERNGCLIVMEICPGGSVADAVAEQSYS